MLKFAIKTHLMNAALYLNWCQLAELNHCLIIVCVTLLLTKRAITLSEVDARDTT